MNADMDNLRKLEPISRLLKALGVPPIETVIPSPRELIIKMGLPLLEDKLPGIKNEIERAIKQLP